MRRTRLRDGPVPVLVLLVVVAVAAAVRGDFTDLFVYRYGGRALLDGLPVYEARDPVKGLPFTYPPFATVAMVPLALPPVRLAAAIMAAVSTAALAVAVALVRRELGRPAPGWLVALLTAGAVALEPVWQNLTFGQVNALLMLAVLVDLLRPDRRGSGVLIGVAAGIKLTPLLFVVLLVLVGRRAAAGRAVLAFAGTIGVGFAAMPGAAATYWTHGVLDGGRVGPPQLAHNQSGYGALTRLLDGRPPTLLWLAVAGPLALAVLLLGAHWWRHGDRVLGTGLAALAMLIASPVSWSHHWVWAAPLALVLWERSRLVAVAWTAVFVTRPIVWQPYGRQREYAWSVPEHVAGTSYLLAALALALWAWMLSVAAQRSAAAGRKPTHSSTGSRGYRTSRSSQAARPHRR